MQFGMVNATKKKTVKMNADVLNALERKAQAKGLTVEQLLANL